MAGSSATELASGKLVLDEPEEGVTRLRIANAPRRGALDDEILEALAGTVRELDARCLVLTGTDQMFSAGYDLGDLDAQRLEQDAEPRVADPFQAAIEALEDFPYPVIASLNGHAIGGGLELALTCDLRLAARGIKVGMPPAKLGLAYSHTGLRRFLDLCGPEHTAELFYVGSAIEVERAYEIGLLSHLVEPRELAQRTLALAAEIAGNAPLSLAGNKRILRALRDHGRALPAEVEQELDELREACLRSRDFGEGLRAFSEKRRPEWSGD